MRSKFNVLLLVGLAITISACQSGQEAPIEIPADTTTTPAESPSPQASSSPTKAQSSIYKALDQLPEGQAYHNVPEKMQVGVPETIEAGMTPEVTEKIKKELQGKGLIRTQSGVPYDPSGVEMKLVVKKDEFDVFEVRTGKQLVTPKTPGKWIWEVTPKKSGDNLIVVKAIVELNVPELKVTPPLEVEVFSARRKVDVNFGYSVNQFVSTNWKEVLSLLVGSGSIAGFVTWWIGKNEKKTKES